MTKKSNQNSSDFKTKNLMIIITICIFGALVFIVFPLLLPKAWTESMPSFTESDMTGRWISVFMAFIFSTIVTNWLLKRQSEEQLETQLNQKKQEKIYEEKLKMYKSYLDELGEIIQKKGEKLDEADEIKLRIKTASIAVHAGNDVLNDLCEEVVKVVRSKYDPFEGEEDWKKFTSENYNGSSVDRKMITSDIMFNGLMKIASCFHKELYNEQQNEENYKDKCDLFARLYLIANQDDEDSSSPQSFEASGLSTLETSIFPNWELTLKGKGEWKMLSLEPKGDNKYGEIYVRPWGDRCAMVMRYLNEAGEAVKEFADEMKYWGFYRSNLRTVYGEWRNTLDDDQWCKKYDAQKLLSNGTYPFPQEIKPDEFLTRYKEDAFFKGHLENMLMSFVKYMEQYRRRCVWKELLSEYATNSDNLKIYPHITTLWCDYSTPSEDGFVRLSLNEETQKDEKILVHVLISRYNADAAFEQLLDALPSVLNKSKEQLMQEVNEKGHIRVASFDFAMNEDSKTKTKTINEPQTNAKVAEIFAIWHNRLKDIYSKA